MHGWAYRWMWALTALAAAATCLALAAPPEAAEAKCRKAVVAGKKECLKTGERCRAANQEDYVRAGLSCRRGRLRPASDAELRSGEPYVVDEEGEISLPTALAAFDQAVAPLPGVSPEKGEIGRVEEAASVMLEIGRQLDRLSRPQRRAYEEAATPAADAVVVPPDATPASTRRAPPTIAEQQTARIWVAEALTVYRGHGFYPAKPISITLLDNKGIGGGKDAAGYVTPESIPHKGTVSPTCNIFITTLGRSQSEDEKMTLVFHEVAHCIQQAFYSSYADAVKPPQWVIEGTPEWMAGTAAEELGEPAAGIFWENWIEKPQLDLLVRDYSAVGFWAMLNQAGIDTWARIRDVMQASVIGGPAAAQTIAFMGTPKIFFDRWGPGFARDPLLGTAWDLTGPGIPNSEPKKYPLANGAVHAFTSTPRSGRAARLDIKADVFAIRTKTGVRGMLAGSDGHVRELEQGAYCAKSGGCKCKTGAQVELPKIGRGIAKTGFGGDPVVPRYVTFAGLSIDQYCKKPSPGPAQCTLPGRQDGDSCQQPFPGIQVNELTEDGGIGPLLATFKRGDCTSGGDFVAIATDGDYRLEVGIQDYQGFDREYVVRSGIPDPEVVVEGPKGTFGNTQFSVPGNPFLGGISLDEKGDMGLGLVPAHNADATAAVSIAGGMDCEYPNER